MLMVLLAESKAKGVCAQSSVQANGLPRYEASHFASILSSLRPIHPAKRPDPETSAFPARRPCYQSGPRLRWAASPGWRSAPTGLVPVEGRLVHQKGGHPFSAPTGLAPVERGFVHQRVACPFGRPHRPRPGRGGACAAALGERRTAPLVHKPPLHRDKPGGGGEGRAPPFLCRSLRSTGASPVGAVRRAQARWGRRREPRPSGAEASTPPGQARWGRFGVRKPGSRFHPPPPSLPP